MNYNFGFVTFFILIFSSSSLSQVKMDDNKRVMMGVLNGDCDDAKNGLEIDWFDNPLNYTCYTPTTPIVPDQDIPSKVFCEELKDDYYPQHICLNKPIEYEGIPTYGDHRPNWPKYGEYKFVPPQRWLHNIEHGAVVMLYHPCTHNIFVNQVRELLTGCLRKHIITPSYLVSSERPIALIGWGCKLEMAHLDRQRVVGFIRNHALHGPEGKLAKNGKYIHQLIKEAKIPNGSDLSDTHICPNN